MDLDAPTLALLALAALGWIVAIATTRALARARTAKRSQSTSYGLLTESFAPWLRSWPGDPARFRHLGDPIDGVQFADDAVYLVEIKTAGARLSGDQKRIRELVAHGRVGWITFYVHQDKEPDIVRPWR